MRTCIVDTLLDNTESDEARRNYLRLFALCIDNSAALNKPGQEFLALLAEKAGCPELCGEIAGLADSPYKTHEYLPVMQALLSDDDKVYTWLTDAFFLLTLCQKKIENPQVLRILSTLKPTQFKENLPYLLALINEINETKVLDAAAKLSPQTSGWKNIVCYRELRFDQSYAKPKAMLQSISITASTLDFELIKVSTKASEYSYFFDSGDDSFLGKVGSAVGASACALGRSSALASLNEVRKKTCEYISENSAVLNMANRMIARLKMPEIGFNNKISYSNYDLDNSAANMQWQSQFKRFEHQVDDTLSAFANACSDADDQLSYFKAGEFDKSVVEIKVQKHATSLLQEQQEKLAKQFVVIEKDGREHRFSIQWQDVENPPCDPEKIRQIKTDGNIWLIVNNDGGFYRSTDCEHWQTVRPTHSEGSLNVRKLEIVNGVWILVIDYKKGFYYSSDALIWHQSCFPELPSAYDFSATADIIHFEGQWLWRFTERTEYSYTEKGIFRDSTKTSTYNRAQVYCASSLEAQWHHWKATPHFYEGVEVESMCSLPGVPCLLVFCKYDSYYTTAKKKNDAASFVSYYLLGKDWRTCTWDCDITNYRGIIVTRMADRLMCFNANRLLTSNKGYDWKRHPEKLSIDDCFHLENVSLFPSRNNSQLIYLSQDAKAFKELMLENGIWRHLCANDQGVLCVYEPNSHETFLRIGQVIFQSI